MDSLHGKRLLILGGINLACEIVETAKKYGIYTMVTDYLEDSPAKKIADEAFMVSTTDIKALVKLCREKKVDGVFTNFIDSLLPYCRELCERLDMPFYLDEFLIREYGTKHLFKRLCNEYGIDTPKQYVLTEEFLPKHLNAIEYPVIVKPVDSSGSKGITICHTENELKDGYLNALSFSRSRTIVVEHYFDSEEITVNYVMNDGKISLTSIHDRYFNREQDGFIRVPDIYIYPSKYTDMFLNNINDRVINMLEKTGFKNGSIFMQACVEDNKVYFYETGTRLNGCKIFHIVEDDCGYNALERMIKFALTGSMGEPKAEECVNPHLKNWYTTMSILVRPGKISKINGIEEIRAMPQVVHVDPWYIVGDEIKDSFRGTLLQTLVRITARAATKQELIDIINKIYDSVDAIDENGFSMLLKKHDIQDLIDNINYELRR